LDRDILKKAIRTIIANDRMSETEESHYIYLFQEEHTGFYKIGYSKNPLKRKEQIRLWKKLILVHEIELSSKAVAALVEKLLHHVFKGKALEGEWFQLTKIDVLFFCSL